MTTTTNTATGADLDLLRRAASANHLAGDACRLAALLHRALASAGVTEPVPTAAEYAESTEEAAGSCEVIAEEHRRAARRHEAAAEGGGVPGVALDLFGDRFQVREEGDGSFYVFDLDLDDYHRTGIPSREEAEWLAREANAEAAGR